MRWPPEQRLAGIGPAERARERSMLLGAVLDCAIVVPIAPALPGRAVSGIELDLVCGFGEAASDVPELLRHALRTLVAHWYEHREPIEIGPEATAIPGAVSELLLPWRRTRL